MRFPYSEIVIWLCSAVDGLVEGFGHCIDTRLDGRLDLGHVVESRRVRASTEMKAALSCRC